MFALALTLLACDLLNPENVGAYTCDQYCEEVVAKTDECAQAAFESECAADPDCGEYSESELAEYAAEGRSDWAGAGQDEMIASCEADLAAAGKPDAECQAETAILNNLACDDILVLLGEIQAAGS